VAGLTATGTIAGLDSGDTVVMTNGADISGITVGGSVGAATGASLGTLTGGATMTVAQYSGLTLTAAGAADAITLTTVATAVTLNAAIETYNLATGTNSVVLGTTGGSLTQTVVGDGTADTVTLGAATYTNTLTGITGITAAAGASDIKGATIPGSAATTLTLNSTSGSQVSMTAAQFNGLGTITAGHASADKVVLSGAGNVRVVSAIETYDLGAVGRTIDLAANTVATTVIGGAGVDIIEFASTATTNGADTINKFLDGGADQLDFTEFLTTESVNTTAADFTGSGLDLTATGANAKNIGVVFNKATALASGDIATATATSKIALNNDAKAVILVSEDVDGTSDSTISPYKVYYVEDTDSSSSQTWEVTLVGTLNSTAELSASALAATAVFV
jgi:hypothetical protein